jgi:penicillin-binding protein 1C
MYVVIGMVGVGLVAVFVVFAYFAKDLPSPTKVVRREGYSTKIYDKNGALLYDLYSDKRRTPVELKDVPAYLQQATIAVEDKNFKKHGGVDPLTPLRIAWNVLTKQRLIGGSSLTQQLVKNVLLTSDRTITRKLKEMILTVQVESKYSKEEILQMYLNEAPYGGTAWGVATAAEMYYGKPVSQLNLIECAILAGLPQSPSAYSPFSGQKLYEGRTKDVLRRMREDGYITGLQETEALEQLPNVKFASGDGVLEAPHFVFYVKELLVKKFGEQVVEQGGLRVITSLDLETQKMAQKVVTEEIAKLESAHITNGAAVVVEPQTGQILAMVGSRGWDDPDYDGKYNVTTALRQPGSSLKPVVYLTGLKKGYTAATLLMDTKTSFPGGDKPEYVPVNYDGKYRGPVLVREALGNSLNVPAVKMLALVGISDMMQQAFDMGFTTLEPTTENLARVGLSVALGGGEVRLLDMGVAYGAFANGGRKIEPVAILKVTDRNGAVLEEWKNAPGYQVMSSGEAYVISSILADNNARSAIFGANSLLKISGRTVAVKTGTTNDRRDNWAVGWTPGVVVGVWVGNNDNSPIKQVASGSSGATPIWRKIILGYLKESADVPFEKPGDVVTVAVDKVTGYGGHDNFPTKDEVFVKGTEPVGEDPVHKLVKVCKGENKLAGPTDIAAGNYDLKEFFEFKEEDPFEKNGQNKWQEGILNWLKDQADSRYKMPTEYCAGSGKQVHISIAQPQDKSQIEEGKDVFVKAEITSINKITKVEILLDGAVRETLTNGPWELTIPRPTKGNHEVKVIAYDESGNKSEDVRRFGYGQAWQEPTPTTTLVPSQ